MMKRMGTVLSFQARSVWAKSSAKDGHWLPLHRHMQDAAGIMAGLYDSWLADGIKRQWARELPGGEADVRALLVWLAAVHDVGKCSPAFAVKVEGLAERMRSAGLPSLRMADYPERRQLHHTLAGFAAISEWLQRQAGLGEVVAEQLASIVGAHHGKAPTNIDRVVPGEQPQLMGDAPWAETRRELLDWVNQVEGMSARWPHWSDLELALPTLVGISGLVIMADWIASNERYFPHVMISDEGPPKAEQQSARVEFAWSELAMPASWSPAVPDLTGTDLYRHRFGWPQSFVPTPVQLKAEEVARTRQAAMVVIEAPMGSGKTEAALIVAEILAARWGASGVMIALPTQATSNAMFDRVLSWLDDLPILPPPYPAWSTTLAHGKALLNERYRGLIPEEDSTGVHDEDVPEGDNECSSYVAHPWFKGRKRNLLANFSVGTIDQVLQAALESKHLMLRHLGLMGKVVVIDEAHASDSYMNTYLDRVLGWLGHYNVPVVVLSATLPALRRVELMKAYVGRRFKDPPGGWFPEAQRSIGYPVITVLDAESPTCLVVQCDVPDASSSQVDLTLLDWEDDQLGELLTGLLADGGCALVVRNTVKAAQATYATLKSLDIAPVTLTHSRFLDVDRRARDQDLLSSFGRDGSHRPDRHIVIGTQVVEQSLDVDFDVLITDLAPMDLLLQRMGRLHRHPRSRPAKLSKAQCYVILQDLDAQPPEADRGSAYIYGKHLLYRTVAALMDRGPVVELPGDIEPLVQRVFGDQQIGAPEWQSEMQRAAEVAESQRARQVAKARTFRLHDWNPGDTDLTMLDWLRQPMPDDSGESHQGRAMVRDADESLEVIVIPLSFDGRTVITPPWLGDLVALDVRTELSDEQAFTISSWAIKLPPHAIGGTDTEGLIRHLQGNPAIKRWRWHRHPLLRGELFMPLRQESDQSNVFSGTLFDSIIRYDPEKGLEVKHS